MLQMKFETGPSKITRAFHYHWKGMGVRNKRAKRSFVPLLEIGTKNQNFVANLKSGAQLILNWFNSCIDSLFAGMTPTVHKNQVHCPGVVQGWVCSSLMSAACHLQRQVAKLACWLFYCWSLLRNNNMATNSSG